MSLWTAIGALLLAAGIFAAGWYVAVLDEEPRRKRACRQAYARGLDRGFSNGYLQGYDDGAFDRRAPDVIHLRERAESR